MFFGILFVPQYLNYCFHFLVSGYSIRFVSFENSEKIRSRTTFELLAQCHRRRGHKIFCEF